MIDLDAYARLRKRCEKAKDEVSRAEGALDQHMVSLKKDFDCETLEEAEALVEQLETEKNEASVKCEEAMAEFQEKWGEKI